MSNRQGVKWAANSENEIIKKDNYVLLNTSAYGNPDIPIKVLKILKDLHYSGGYKVLVKTLNRKKEHYLSIDLVRPFDALKTAAKTGNDRQLTERQRAALNAHKLFGRII